MKSVILALLLALPLAAEDRVFFAEKAYSLEFPADWKKAASPEGEAEFSRQSADESVLLTVRRTKIPAGASADLAGMAKSSAESFAKAIGFKGEATISEGTLDGCDARFITLMPQKEEEGEIGVFAVFIDTKTDLVTLRATMAPGLPEATRKACIEIVKSFRREEAEKEE
ncbi:MAG: hypothetical protein MUF31_15965 [Akkermansiaceae bacterium]|jgi:hypothetical protein|nr:hypothetical protein [Akkermansiaceae bacterium]